MGRSFIATVAFIFFSMAAHAASLDVPSTWANQRTSTLTVFSTDENGKFDGVYINEASGTSCIGTPYEAHGQIKGHNITVTTTFTDCHTVTVWHGIFDGSSMKTKFEAAYPSSDGHIKIWRGSDNFVRR